MLVFLYQLKIVKPIKKYSMSRQFLQKNRLARLFSVEECHEEAVSLREIYF